MRATKVKEEEIAVPALYIDPSVKRTDNPPYSTTLSEAINEIYGNEAFCDYKIKLSDGSSLPCHKLVLYSRSEFFKTMFSSDFKDSGSDKITLDYFEPHVVHELVGFMYDSDIVIEWDEMEKFLGAMSFLGMDDIKGECDDYIQWNITQENAAKWFAISLGVDLKNVSFMLRSRFFSVISESEDFLTLSLGKLKEIIESDDITCNEDVILKACLRWLEVKGNRSKDPTCSIVSSIRYKSCSRECLNALPRFAKQCLPIALMEELGLEPLNDTKCFFSDELSEQIQIDTSSPEQVETKEGDKIAMPQTVTHSQSPVFKQSSIRDYFILEARKGKKQADIRDYVTVHTKHVNNEEVPDAQASLVIGNCNAELADEPETGTVVASAPLGVSDHTTCPKNVALDFKNVEKPRGWNRLQNVMVYDCEDGERRQMYIRDNESGNWYIGSHTIFDSLEDEKIAEGTICNTPRGLIITGGRAKMQTFEGKGKITHGCMIYDGMRNHSYDLLPMPCGRAEHICLILDNKMYVIGGKKSKGHYTGKETTICELLCLHLDAMKWTEHAPLLEEMKVVSVSGGEGFLFILGMVKGDPVFHKYDICQDEWQELMAPPHPSLVRPSIYYKEGKVYLACFYRDYELYVHRYHVADGFWTQNVSKVTFPVGLFPMGYEEVETSVLQDRLVCMSYKCTVFQYYLYHGQCNKLKWFDTESLSWKPVVDSLTGWMSKKDKTYGVHHELRKMHPAVLDIEHMIDQV